MDHSASGAPLQPLLFAPGELLRCGLSAAHPRPLVGARTPDGVRSWRSSPDRAWGYPLVEWGRAGSSYAALVLDCDSRDSVERVHACAMGAGPLPTPNVTMTRRASGHVHAAWILGTPVHRGATAREKPRRLFGRIGEYFTVTAGADSGYVGVLAGNPTHDDYASAYPRDEPYELRDLARVIPARWRVPAVPVSEPGRNCALFAALCKLALRCSDDGLLTWARTLNRDFSPSLPEADVRATWASVCRYRARWRAQGHKPEWRARQAAVGRKGGAAGKGKARAASLFDDLSNEASRPWDAEAVSRRTWYRRRATAKTAGESLGGEGGTDSQYR